MSICAVHRKKVNFNDQIQLILIIAKIKTKKTPHDVE